MVFERVQEIIAEKLDLDPEEITMESSLDDDLEADSLDVIEIITALEMSSISHSSRKICRRWRRFPTWYLILNPSNR